MEVAGAEAYGSCVKERGERQVWLFLSVDFNHDRADVGGG